MSRRGLIFSPKQLADYKARFGGQSAPALLKPVPQSPVPNKHGAVQTSRGGLTFASKHEAKVWDDLLLRKLAGEFTHIQRQVNFPFVCDGVRVGSYKCDFFCRKPSGEYVVMDAKSVHTRTLPGWKRTKMLMLSCYGFQIQEM